MARTDVFRNDVLREERLARGWTLRKLAERSGLSAPAILYYERGEQTPGLAAVVSLSKALGIPVTRLIREP